MMTNKKKDLHIGADLQPRFVLRFRKYCKGKNYKQLALIKHLIEWWLNQDTTVQEHIYYGRFAEIPTYFSTNSEGMEAAIADENAAGRASAKSQRKREGSAQASKSG